MILTTGARYGEIDVPWLVSHLSRHVLDNNDVCLALDRRAIFAFDDFMVARFHMFAMVYFHQKSIAYEEMLKRHMWSDACQYRLPSDMAGYCDTDDAHLWAYLRESSEPWARRVVEYRPFKVAKGYGQPGQLDLSDSAAQLEAEDIPHFIASASGAMGDGSDKLGNPICVGPQRKCMEVRCHWLRPLISSSDTMTAVQFLDCMWSVRTWIRLV